MTEMKSWHRSATLEWMTTILRERFGLNFNLKLQSAGSVIAITLPEHSRCITLAVDGAIFTRADSDLPCDVWDVIDNGWSPALPGTLPAPGAVQLPRPLIFAGENGWHCGYDILGLVYWMLTRQEEVGRTDKDMHGRFPATSSHAYKHGYLERPVVDEWLHILGQIIIRTWPNIKIKKHNFNIMVSHDVDRPSRYAFRTMRGMARAMAGDVLKRGDIKSAVLALWVRMRSRQSLHSYDPANTFDWLMDVSEHHGLTSAFYFICGRTDRSKDADYELEHPAIRELMRRIHARGHEIGLHPSYGSYQSPSIIKREADRLRRIAFAEGIEQAEWGGRMHYLRWEQPTTLRAWADAGMAYDSTLGFADLPGFRCGTCFEYPAFDPVLGVSINLRLRPLIAMECTIMAPGYMGLGTGQASLAKFLQLKQACQAVHGCFTLLWHNSEFDTASARELYKAVLR